MFEQLTESNENQQNAHGRRGYFLATTVIVGALFLSGVVWSLYGKDLVLGSGDLEMSAVMTPVMLPENAPKPPQPKMERREIAQADARVTTRNDNILRVDENPRIPVNISTVPNTGKARTNSFRIAEGLEKTGGIASLATGSGRPTGNGGPEYGSSESTEQPEEAKVLPPPPVTVKKIENVVAKNTTISGGVVNGKATDLPKPVYSPAALAVRAGGVVSVQVTIDETGNVISARAVSGHPLLRQSAERAARDARFKPTLLSNQPVKVTGVITYNFNRN